MCLVQAFDESSILTRLVHTKMLDRNDLQSSMSETYDDSCELSLVQQMKEELHT
jgi:hypothetical protein